MPRIVLSLAEWRAVAREFAAAHTSTAPAGIEERIQALLTGAHDGWVDRPFVLELDESGARAVQAVHQTLTGADLGAGQRSASVTEADTIIRDHQRHP